jgi:hypothetical protein
MLGPHADLGCRAWFGLPVMWHYPDVPARLRYQPGLAAMRHLPAPLVTRHRRHPDARVPTRQPTADLLSLQAVSVVIIVSKSSTRAARWGRTGRDPLAHSYS